MKNIFVLLILAGGVLLPGCISYTTLQTAETLEPGNVIIGGGTALMFGGNDVGFQPEVNARIGIVNNFDIGAKYVIPSLFFADGKVRLISDPLSLSFDLGWSTFSYIENSGKSKGVSTGWYPMLLLGKEHWYAGVRPVYFITQGEVEFFGLQKFGLDLYECCGRGNDRIQSAAHAGAECDDPEERRDQHCSCSWTAVRSLKTIHSRSPLGGQSHKEIFAGTDDVHTVMFGGNPVPLFMRKIEHG